jgi:hypothetical protein
MTTPIKFTGTTKAWTTSHWQNIDTILHRVNKGELDEAASTLMYINQDMSDSEGWAEVGVATITVELYPREELVSKELDGLKVQLEKVRADNQQRENAILDRISKLLAVTYDAPEENTDETA